MPQSRTRIVASLLVASSWLVAAGDTTTAVMRTAGGGVERAAGSEPGDGPSGTLRFATDSDLAGIWDPHRTASPFATPLLFPVYEPLIRYSEGGLVPGIAQEWSFAEDGSSFELVLRDGVTFHDGESLDAEAVVANIERAQTVEGSSLVDTLSNVSGVVAVDELTVRFELAELNAALPGLLADRAGMMISPAAFDNPDLDLIGVGAGPYVLAENSPGSTVRLTAHGDYWDTDMSRVEEIAIEILDPAAAANAFLDGQLDTVDVAPGDVADFESDGYRVEVFTGAEVQIMYLNKTGALADERVREAISLAIDRVGLSDALTAGLCEPTGQAFGEGTVPYDESIPVPAYDPQAARDLLQEAGVTDVVIDMVTFPADTTAEALVPMLDEVGITLNVTKVAPPELTDLFVSGQVEAYYTRLSGSTEPAVTLDVLLGRFNPGGHSDEQLTALAADAAAEIDPEARIEVFRQINDRLSELVWNVPICNVAVPYAYQDNVIQFGLTSLNTFDWYNLEVAG